MKHRKTLREVLFFIGLLSCQISGAAEELPLSNDHLSFEFKKANGTWHCVAELNTNKATGDVTAIGGDAFAFQIVGVEGDSWFGSSECKLDNGKIIETEGQRTLTYLLSSAANPRLSCQIPTGFSNASNYFWGIRGDRELYQAR